MFEWTVGLRLVVHQFLLGARYAALLFCRQLIHAPQRVFDALNRANWVRCVQVRGIRGSPSDKQFRDTLALFKQPESAASALTQNLEATKLPSRLHRLIVFPRENREGQSLGCFFSRSF